MTLLATVEARIERTLKAAGFQKRGGQYSANRNDVVLLLQLQRSVSSTKENIRITLNAGVFSPSIAKTLGFAITNPKISNCHWSERLGYMLPIHKDVWLEVHNEDQAREVGDELAEALDNYVLPALNAVDSNSKLKSLWSGGKSNGITSIQRQDYLKALSQGIAT